MIKLNDLLHLTDEQASKAKVTAFCDVTPEEQIGRIRKRNGEKMLQMFRSRWIPMEEKYFEHYSIKDNADLRA